MEVYSEDEESDSEGWDSGWVIWTRTRTTGNGKGSTGGGGDP